MPYVVYVKKKYHTKWDRVAGIFKSKKEAKKVAENSKKRGTISNYRVVYRKLGYPRGVKRKYIKEYLKTMRY